MKSRQTIEAMKRMKVKGHAETPNSKGKVCCSLGCCSPFLDLYMRCAHAMIIVGLPYQGISSGQGVCGDVEKRRLRMRRLVVYCDRQYMCGAEKYVFSAPPPPGS